VLQCVAAQTLRRFVSCILGAFQSVVVCFSALQCVAVCFSAVAEARHVLYSRCVVVRCSALQCVAVCCSVLQRSRWGASCLVF